MASENVNAAIIIISCNKCVHCDIMKQLQMTVKGLIDGDM